MSNKQPMKLQDLFKTGDLVTVDLGEEGSFEIYMRKPTPGQRDEAVSRAKAKQMRVKRLYRDKDGDDYQSILAVVENLSPEEIAEKLVEFDAADLRQKAYNEVLYGDLGSDWSEKGLSYVDLIGGIQARMEEIQKINDEAPSDEEKIQYHLDEELTGLMQEREKFEAEVKEIADAAVQERIEELSIKSHEELINRFCNRSIELEANMAWFQDYRVNMLYLACRTPEDHDQLYFEDRSQIEELPYYISIRLHDELDRIDRGVGELKNLPSPQSS